MDTRLLTMIKKLEKIAHNKSADSKLCSNWKDKQLLRRG